MTKKSTTGKNPWNAKCLAMAECFDDLLEIARKSKLTYENHMKNLSEEEDEWYSELCYTIAKTDDWLGTIK